MPHKDYLGQCLSLKQKPDTAVVSAGGLVFVVTLAACVLFPVRIRFQIID